MSIVTQFRQRFAAEADMDRRAPINRGTPNPPRRQPPGERALEWCRANIPNFRSHERQANEALAATKAAKAKAGLQ